MAGDLRAIIAAMNIAIELERIGDHAKGIATITQHIGQTAPIKPLVDIPRMAEISRVMLRQSLDAFVQHDPTLAHVVVEHDRAVNQLYNQVVRELISSIIEDPHRVIRAMDLMFAAHSLERLADRVTNICERVVYLSTGQLAEFSDDSPHV
jgi:phosphate transport system protein